MGRFLSPDPSQLYYADLTNPQSFNLYAYALNNPLTNTDPTGMYCYYGDTDYTSAQGQKDQADATQWDYHSNSGECGDAETHTDYNGISWDNDGRHEFAVSAISDATPQPQVQYTSIGAQSCPLCLDPNYNYSQDFIPTVSATPWTPMPVHAWGHKAASKKDWWEAVKTCAADSSSQPQNVKAPTPGGGADTDSNPAADVRHYSNSREQGHQVSPQMNNQQSAEGMEGVGNAAAMFQDFNECVNRVLGGH